MESPRVGLIQQHKEIIKDLGSFHLPLCSLRQLCFQASLFLGHKMGPSVLVEKIGQKTMGRGWDCGALGQMTLPKAFNRTIFLLLQNISLLLEGGKEFHRCSEITVP